jgi:hypothetical protein
MKGFSSAGLLAVIMAVSITAGCTNPFSEESCEKEIIAVGEYPGVYLTNDMAALPLATSGYDIYLVGEYHGIREVHLLFVEYLKMLHETCGLHDVILEVNQHAEEEANAYTLGKSEEFPEDLWNRPDRLDVLEHIRAVNRELSDKEKIRVHLVDLDVRVTSRGYDGYVHIYTHLNELREELGAEYIDIPPLEEFEKWDEDAVLGVVEKLEENADNEVFLNELRTVRASVEFKDWTRDFDVREETIARNIQYVLKELDGAPVLALYGAYHACKVTDEFLAGDTWAQRLIASGVSVYSVVAAGISGQQWIDYRLYEVDGEQFWFDDIPLDENTVLETIFDEWPGYEILFADLHTITHLRIPRQWSRPGNFSFETRLSDVYDGIILFREVTPSRTS